MQIRGMLFSMVLTVAPFVCVMGPIFLSGWNCDVLHIESIRPPLSRAQMVVQAVQNDHEDIHSTLSSRAEEFNSFEGVWSANRSDQGDRGTNSVAHEHRDLTRAQSNLETPIAQEEEVVLPIESNKNIPVEVEDLIRQGRTDVAQDLEECVQPDPDQRRYGPMIESRDDGTIGVPSAMLTFYATHPARLRLLGGTWTQRVNGERVGFRVQPTDCSILFNAGFETNDVILSINGHRVSTLFEAIRTYLRLNDSRQYEVEIQRRDERVLLTFVLTELPTELTNSDIRRERRYERRIDRRNRRAVVRSGSELAQQID